MISAEAGLTAQKQIKKMEENIQRMLANMWLIIVSLTLVSLYGYVYSQAIFFTPQNGSCHFPDVGQFVNNLNTIVERFVTYVLWTVPIIYVFWPSYRTWYGIKKNFTGRGSSVTDV